MYVTIFVDFVICHQMALLRKLYSVILAHFLKFKNLKSEYLRNGER